MSILKQQKRLWFLAGTAAAGLGLLALERDAWEGTARVAAALPNQIERPRPQEPAPLFGREFFGTAARQWNTAVDSVFQPVIRELAKRGL
jgi:hypothetical protein